MNPALTQSSRFAEKPVPVCPPHGCAVGKELTTSSHHTVGCRRVTAFAGTSTTFSLGLTLLSFDVKLPGFGTCIAILNVHCIFFLFVCIKAVPVWADLYPRLVRGQSGRWHVL